MPVNTDVWARLAEGQAVLPVPRDVDFPVPCILLWELPHPSYSRPFVDYWFSTPIQPFLNDSSKPILLPVYFKHLFMFPNFKYPLELRRLNSTPGEFFLRSTVAEMSRQRISEFLTSQML